jgi:magnesium chelatase accessory protein
MSLAADSQNPARSALPDDWPNAGLSRFVRAAGIDWHVQRAGRGPPLLLVHGTGGSTHSWRDLLPLLAAHFDVIAMDLPGHGFTSSVSDREMSMPRLAAALRRLCTALAIEPRVAVGHSAGAAILVRMCIDAIIAPCFIVSVNGALLPFGSPLGRLFSPAAKIVSRLGFWPRWVARRATRTDMVARLIDGMGSRLDPESLALYERLARMPGHVEAALGMMARWDLDALSRDLSGLRTPMLQIVGARDRAIPPADADRIAARLTDVETVHLAAAGHLAQEELPVATAELIIARAHHSGVFPEPHG